MFIKLLIVLTNNMALQTDFNNTFKTITQYALFTVKYLLQSTSNFKRKFLCSIITDYNMYLFYSYNVWCNVT